MLGARDTEMSQAAQPALSEELSAEERGWGTDGFYTEAQPHPVGAEVAPATEKFSFLHIVPPSFLPSLPPSSVLVS